jgi:hypothetical protein
MRVEKKAQFVNSAGRCEEEGSPLSKWAGRTETEQWMSGPTSLSIGGVSPASLGLRKTGAAPQKDRPVGIGGPVLICIRRPKECKWLIEAICRRTGLCKPRGNRPPKTREEDGWRRWADAMTKVTVGALA